MFKRFIPLLAVTAILSACVHTGGGTIKIGFIGPLTGDISSLGSDLLNATEMKIKEVNEAGGINGRMVELIAEDGRCTGGDAAAAAQKLVNIDQVDAMVAGQCSGETLAAAPVAEAAQILMVSPVSSSPDVTTAGDFIFRTYPSDDLKGAAFNKVFADKEFTKVAIISENTDFCQGILASVKKYMPEGVEYVYEETVEPGAKDFRTLFTRLQDVEFDVFIANAQTDTAGSAMVNQFRELGFEQMILGSDVIDSNNMFELAGDSLDNVFAISVPLFDESSEFATNFVSAYGEAKFGLGYAANAYDATSVVLEAIEAVGTDGPALKDHLYGMGTYKGEGGTFTFDSNGDADGFPFALKGFKDGAIYQVELLSTN